MCTIISTFSILPPQMKKSGTPGRASSKRKCPRKVKKSAIYSPVLSSVPKIRFCPSAVNGSAQIHQSYKKRFLFLYKKPSRLPITETGAVIYFIGAFSSPHAIPCGGLDCRLSGCQNYRALGGSDDTLFVNFQCVLPHLRNDLLQIFFPQIEFRQFCLVI